MAGAPEWAAADPPRMVVRTLERTCGPGNYYYVAQL
jgi:hypothetical protein